MYSMYPNSYLIEGKDISGDDAYSIKAQLEYLDDHLEFKSLSIAIYGNSIQIDSSILEEALNPHMGLIEIINDSGIFGSQFYIRIPFGEVGSCREAKKNEEYREIYISSLGTSKGAGLRAKIYDPCDEP